MTEQVAQRIIRMSFLPFLSFLRQQESKGISFIGNPDIIEFVSQYAYLCDVKIELSIVSPELENLIVETG